MYWGLERTLLLDLASQKVHEDAVEAIREQLNELRKYG